MVSLLTTSTIDGHYTHTLEQNTFNEDATGKNTQAKNTLFEAKAAHHQADVITVSSEAVYAAKSAYYEQFMPTREGFSARNLALGVANPTAQPFSQNRAFDEVALLARNSLDSKYQQMTESGRPFDINSNEGIDARSAFGDLDRRALYAVASNEGGHFSKQEQSTARDLMRTQQGLAMGLYSGPSRLQGDFVGISLDDRTEKFERGQAFLDRVSVEEKASDPEWAQQRATSQWAISRDANDKDQETNPLKTDHPLVTLLKSAFEAWKQRLDKAESTDEPNQSDDQSHHTKLGSPEVKRAEGHS